MYKQNIRIRQIKNIITNVRRLSNNFQNGIKMEKRYLLTAKIKVCYGIFRENPTQKILVPKGFILPLFAPRSEKWSYSQETVPLQKIWLPCKIRKNLHN
jgi:hypothetical protein